MSIAAIHWAWKQDLEAYSKLVLLALADYAGSEHETCFPSLKTLSGRCGQSVSSIQRSLATLEAKGFISKQRRKAESGGWRSNLYRLHLTPDPIPPQTIGYTPTDHRGIPPQTIGYTPTDQGGIPQLTNEPLIYNHLIESNPVSRDDTAPSPKKPRRTREPKPDPITEAVVEDLVAEFAPLMGGESAVRASILRALNHKSSRGWIDRVAGLRAWIEGGLERGYGAPRGTYPGLAGNGPARAGERPATERDDLGF